MNRSPNEHLHLITALAAKVEDCLGSGEVGVGVGGQAGQAWQAWQVGKAVGGGRTLSNLST